MKVFLAHTGERRTEIKWCESTCNLAPLLLRSGVYGVNTKLVALPGNTRTTRLHSTCTTQYTHTAQGHDLLLNLGGLEGHDEELANTHTRTHTYGTTHA